MKKFEKYTEKELNFIQEIIKNNGNYNIHIKFPKNIEEESLIYSLTAKNDEVFFEGNYEELKIFIEKRKKK